VDVPLFAARIVQIRLTEGFMVSSCVSEIDIYTYDRGFSLASEAYANAQALCADQGPLFGAEGLAAYKAALDAKPVPLDLKNSEYYDYIDELKSLEEGFLSTLPPDLYAYPLVAAKQSDGSLAASASIGNKSPAACSPNAIFALYNDVGRLLEAKSVKKALPGGGKENFSAKFVGAWNFDETYAKLFVWDDNFKPLLEAQELDLDIAESYMSATASGLGNMTAVKFQGSATWTFRSYLKPVDDTFSGAQTFRFSYTNAVDSTFANNASRLANTLGSPFTVEEAYVSDGGPLGADPLGAASGPFEQVYFNGAASKNVLPGETFWSDDVEYDLPNGHYLCFTWVLSVEKLNQDSVPYNVPFEASRFGGLKAGNHAKQTSGDGFSNSSRDKTDQPVPAPNIFAIKRSPSKRMAFIGDSFTNGTNTTVGEDNFWVGHIARGLAAQNISVENLGLSWARAYDAATDGFWLAKAKSADEISIVLGINDLGVGARTSAQIIADLKDVIAAAKKANPDCIATLFTIPPASYSTAAASSWSAVNGAILGANGKTEFGYDFAYDTSIVWGKQQGSPEMKSEYRSSDGMHPNDAAGAALAAHYLEWLEKRYAE
jgi:lysophospholipase L1-like esterase